MVKMYAELTGNCEKQRIKSLCGNRKMTKFEDLETKAVYAMLSTADAMTGASGAMEEMNKTAEETFDAKWQGFLRTAQDALIPIGTILLDLATKYLPIVAGWIEKVATAFAALPQGAQTTVIVIGALLALLGPLLIVFGAIISSIGSIVGAFGPLLGVFKGLLSIGPAIGGALRTVATGFMAAGPAVAGFAGIFGRVLTTILRFIPGVGLAVTAITLLIPLFKNAGGDIMAGLGEGLLQGLNYVLAGALFVGNSIISFFKNLFGIASPSKLFNQFGQWIMQGLANGIRSLVGLVTGIFSGLFTGLKTITTNGINSVVSFAKKGFNALASGARSAGSAISSAIGGAITSAMSAAKAVASKAFSLGSDIVGGIAKGVRSGVKKAKDAITSVSNGIMNSFKKDNGINSPARAYITEAAHLPGGIAGGIMRGTGVAVNAMKNVVKKTGDAFIQARDGLPLDMPLDTLGMTPNFDAATERLGGLQDVPQSIQGFNAGGKGQQKGGVHVNGNIVMHVQEATDLTPQEIENDVSNRFFPNARERE